MDNIVIKIEGVGKQYRLGQVGTGTISNDINRWFHKLVGKEDPYTKVGEINDPSQKGGSDIIWALRDVSFEVKQGEVLGIIGKNGAGKSTLLKILSRVTTPTVGAIKAKGRIASLLEVGTGFHPELTGRENIFLNGAILGMTKQEIRSKFDEIVSFSGVERYIDTPVKRYSSGMYVRLAFAVAAHLDPEILIVDEVLAVGDAEFQKKCMGRMKDISGEGRTVIFVSHNMDAVLRLCSHCILLKNGKVDISGEVDSVVEHYLSAEYGVNFNRKWNLENAPGNDIARLIEVYVHNENFEKGGNFNVTEKIGVTIKYEVIKDGHVFTHAMNLHNSHGVNILNSHDVVSKIRHEPRRKGIYTATMWIPANLLSEGIVLVGPAVFVPVPYTLYFGVVDAVSFNVYDNITGNSARGNYHGNFPGIVRPLLQWETTLL